MRHGVSRWCYNLTVKIHKDVNQLGILNDAKRSMTMYYPEGNFHSQLVKGVGGSLGKGYD
jgi:hypothetical protein